MQKKVIRVVSCFITGLMVFTAAGCSSQTTGNTNGVTVKAAAADRHKLQTSVEVAGVLVPRQTVNIVSKLSGQVVTLGAETGSRVKEGETLISIETKVLNAQLQQAEAALQSAQAAAQTARIQGEQAKISLDTAQKAFDRTRTLFDSGAASQSQLDEVTTKLDIAKKQYEAAAGSALNQAQASISTAQANINNIKVQMENATITSPIAGIITNRNINPGEVASPGIALLTIADTSILKLKGTVSQEVLPRLKEGQEINVSVDIYPGKEFKGQIDSIGPVAVSTGTYFPIEISIKNTDNLKAGLSAHASVSMTAEEGVVVPASAVAQNNGQSYVFVLKNNIVTKRVVTVGLKNDKEMEIVKGLEAGEQVAASNVNSLFDNMPVIVN